MNAVKILFCCCMFVSCEKDFILDKTMWKVDEVVQTHSWQNIEQVYSGLLIKFEKDSVIGIRDGKTEFVGSYAIIDQEPPLLELNFQVFLNGTLTQIMDSYKIRYKKSVLIWEPIPKSATGSLIRLAPIK